MNKNGLLGNFDLEGKDGLKQALIYLASRVSVLEEELSDLRSYVYELEDSIDFDSCDCCSCEEENCDCCNCTDCCDDDA